MDEHNRFEPRHTFSDEIPQSVLSELGLTLTPSRSQRRLRQDITDLRDAADITEPMLANEPIENADANDAIDPIDKIDPTLPIDRIDPFEPIDRMEFSDFQDNTLRAAIARFSCNVSWYPERHDGGSQPTMPRPRGRHRPRTATRRPGKGA